jgi:amino acid adenylation domain-containing protein
MAIADKQTKSKNIESIYPLSSMQQGMLFHTLYAPESGVYVEQLSCTLNGYLDIPAFEQAWQHVVQRHAVLRTLFVWENRKKPLQVVRKVVDLAWVHEDWRSHSSREQQEKLETFLQSDRAQGFELDRAPLLRYTLIHLDHNTYQLVWSYHHLLLDGWSLSKVIQEVFAFYEAFSKGEDLYLPTPQPYESYINWLQQQDSAEAERFWRQKLQGLTAPTPLTVDRLSSDREQLPNTATEHILFATEATAALQAFVKQHQLTLNNLVQGAWALLLSHYSGEFDVVFGATVSGRPSMLMDVESMVGLFINTLPMRVQVTDDTQLLPWLKALQAQQVESEQYAHTPLVEIQAWSDIPGGVQLFESIVVFENYPIDTSLQEQGGSLDVLNIKGTEQTNYPLTLVVILGEQLSIALHYDTGRFDRDAIARMTGHLQTLLMGILASPEQYICELPLLTTPERQQLLVEWNDTQADYLNDWCIHQLFEHQVERNPDAVAVVFKDQYLTYWELNTRANQLAYYLQAMGVGPDVLVGICAERSFDLIVGLLGILKAGGAYVPLDPNYPSERLGYILADSQTSVLLTQKHLVERLPKHRATIICLDMPWYQIAQRNPENPISGVKPCHLSYVIYTSGSTGQPKGVQVEHQGLLNLVFWHQRTFAITPSDRATLLAGIAFDASAWELWPYLGTGASIYLVESELLGSLTNLQNWFITNNISIAFLPTPLAEEFLSLEWDDTIPLRTILTGGDKLHKYPPTSVPFELVNNYGPTENTVVTTSERVIRNGSDPVAPAIGRPISNKQVYILNPNLQPVPIGVPGELHISGVGLARGYLNRPELTQEKFIPNPFSPDPQARLYKTGDLVRYLPDGNIEYLGRIDNQVKIRGFRIELGEIETILSQHPDVLKTVAIAREDSPGDNRIVVYLVCDLEQPPAIADLRQFLKQRLPEYMVPAVFVFLESLPLTPNGKIDRRALPAPDFTQQLEAQFVAPRNPLEQTLAQIWADVLGLERVGIRDNFFELGGHSLLATQLISRVRTAFKLEVPLRNLFESPTIIELAEYIQRSQRGLTELAVPPLQAIAPDKRNEPLPLSFAQQRLWFLQQLNLSSAAYHIPGAVRLQGQLDVVALERSFKEIVRRHEALRTNFIFQNGQPVQVVQADSAWHLTVVDLQHLPTVESESETQRLAIAQTVQPFDLTEDRLVRITLLVLSETEHILLFCMHHIVSDGWSMGTFVQELAALYPAFHHDRLSPLPQLSIQYADFAVWQRQWLQGEVLKSQIDYWQKQLADAPALLDLPSDRPRPSVQSWRGATQSFILPLELTEAIAALSRRESVTLFMALLAAFDVLLYRYTGQMDILVGSPIANRNHSEIEGLIGFFVNTIVLRADLSNNPSFRELLGRVRENCLGAYAHQDLPFELLVEGLHLERDLSYTPLFQVMFVLQNAPMSDVELPGLTLSVLAGENQTAKFDLTLTIEETEEGLMGLWEYNTDLFDSTTIARMAGHYQRLLESIVAKPEQRIHELPMLTAAEQNQLIEWNHTQTDYPREQCIHQIFEQQVERTPNAVAVMFVECQLTYRELNSRANQLAHYLRSQGVRAEVLVGICVERSIDLIVGMLGILKAGGAYVPLDPNYPQERLSYMLADAQVSVLLTQQQLVEGLPEVTVKVVCLDSDWQTITAESTESIDNLPSEITADSLAYVIYTSGSTGQPKGVAVPHRAVNRLVLNTDYVQLNQSDRIAQASNASFDAATFEIWGALLNGARLVGVPQHVMLSLQEFAVYIREHGISVLFLTTALFNQIVSFVPQAFGSLRYLLFGGEAVDPRWVREVLQHSAPQHLLHVYGPTENTTYSSWFLVRDVAETATTIPIGRAIANSQIYVLDRNLQAVPVGVPGELHVGGDGLACGYLNRPELTQEKFIPNPFSNDPQARLYKTGDLVRYLCDGSIEYIGRIDNQVKIRGFRIELGEIETALLQHPDIREVVVLAREDIPGDRRLVAYVVLHLEQSLEAQNISDLRSFLQSQLPNYMLPSAFVLLDRFPLTPNGKIDRRNLPAPDLSAQSAATYIAPRSEIEKAIAATWQEVLQLEKVGMDDNFFDLGGHSLLMVQLAQKLQVSLEREISLLEIFKYPTIATFTKYLTTEASEVAAISEKSSQQIADVEAGRNRLKQRLARSSKGASPEVTAHE